MTSLEARIDRLESLDAIRQLPAKYALALDMRDMEAMVSLFPADVRVGKDASGRAARAAARPPGGRVAAGRARAARGDAPDAPPNNAPVTPHTAASWPVRNSPSTGVRGCSPRSPSRPPSAVPSGSA